MIQLYPTLLRLMFWGGAAGRGQKIERGHGTREQSCQGMMIGVIGILMMIGVMMIHLNSYWTLEMENRVREERRGVWLKGKGFF